MPKLEMIFGFFRIYVLQNPIKYTIFYRGIVFNLGEIL